MDKLHQYKTPLGTSENKCERKHKESVHEPARYMSTGLTDLTKPATKKRHTPVKPVQSKLHLSVDPTSTG